MSKFMSRLIAILFMALVAAGAAQATTTATISSNVNGMRQLSPSNIVQQYPGAAPYYGPSICQQQLSNFQQQMGPGYACQCPQGAQTPVCTPICSALLPTYQQQAGPTYSCACPVDNQVPVCTPIPCSGLLSYYQGQYPGYICTCPVGAATPQCVLPPPTCAQLLPTYQAQYQAQQGAGVPITCSCPNPNATSNPVCSCGSPYTGFYLVNWQQNDGANFGQALYFVDANNNVTVYIWEYFWTGAFMGTGSVSSSGVASAGTVIDGHNYDWNGNFSSNGSSGYGTYWDTTLPAGPSTTGTWSAEKIASYATNCSAMPPCGNTLAAISGVMSASGTVCSCPTGSSAAVQPECMYQSCQAAEQMPTGPWTWTRSDGVQCSVFLTASSSAQNLAPYIAVSGTCQDGATFGNGGVTCSQGLSNGFTAFLNGTGYSVVGQFSGSTFSGSVVGTGITISGYYN